MLLVVIEMPDEKRVPQLVTCCMSPVLSLRYVRNLLSCLDATLRPMISGVAAYLIMM
jgi:hypothetical protein